MKTMFFDKLAMVEPRHFCEEYGFHRDIANEKKLLDYGEYNYEIIKVVDDNIAICIWSVSGHNELYVYKFELEDDCPFHKVVDFLDPMPFIQDFSHELIGLRYEHDEE